MKEAFDYIWDLPYDMVDINSNYHSDLNINNLMKDFAKLHVEECLKNVYYILQDKLDLDELADLEAQFSLYLNKIK